MCRTYFCSRNGTKNQDNITRVQCEKVRRANAQRPQAEQKQSKVREGKGERGKDKDFGVNNGKSTDQQEGKVIKEKTGKGMRRVLKH